MRILVAGGAGFIGPHYVRTLISGGYPGFRTPFREGLREGLRETVQWYRDNRSWWEPLKPPPPSEPKPRPEARVANVLGAP